MTLTGWTFDEIDDAPGHRLDWLLEVDKVVQRARAEANDRG